MALVPELSEGIPASLRLSQEVDEKGFGYRDSLRALHNTTVQEQMQAAALALAAQSPAKASGKPKRKRMTQDPNYLDKMQLEYGGGALDFNMVSIKTLALLSASITDKVDGLSDMDAAAAVQSAAGRRGADAAYGPGSASSYANSPSDKMADSHAKQMIDAAFMRWAHDGCLRKEFKLKHPLTCKIRGFSSNKQRFSITKLITHTELTMAMEGQQQAKASAQALLEAEAREGAKMTPSEAKRAAALTKEELGERGLATPAKRPEDMTADDAAKMSLDELVNSGMRFSSRATFVMVEKHDTVRISAV